MKIVGNSLFQKAANSALILNYLRTHMSASRQQMAVDLGLQPSTVSYIVGRLIKAGLVEEFHDESPKKSGSGRRPISVRLISGFGYVIGLDLQVDYFCAVICDVKGQVLEYLWRDYSPGVRDFHSLLLYAVDEVKSCLNDSIPILGMGLAIPGIVDRESGFVVECWTHKLKDVDLSGFLEENFSFPVMVENDANCCAQNILWNRPEGEGDSFVYLLSRFHKRQMLPESLPSIGIGLGLVFNGQLFTGISHQAGEYQSILYSPGRNLEWQISLSAEEMDRALYDKGIRKEIIRELMGNMILILQVLNPRALYIGGDLSKSEDLVRQVLEEDYKLRWTSLEKKGCALKVVDEGTFDPAGGAAACMHSALFAIPQVGNSSGGKKQWNTLLSNVIEDNS